MTKIPEYQQQEEFQNRSRKLGEIRQAKVDPYPHQYKPTHTALAIHHNLTARK